MQASQGIRALLNFSRVLYDELMESETLDCEWETRGLLFVLKSHNGMDHFAPTAELLRESWIMPDPDNLAWTMMIEGFAAAGVQPPTPQVVSNSMAVRIRLVESGRFLSILPNSTLHFGRNRLRMKKLPVRLPMKTRPIEVITLKNRTPNPIANLFINELRAYTKRLAAGAGKIAPISKSHE